MYISCPDSYPARQSLLVRLRHLLAFAALLCGVATVPAQAAPDFTRLAIGRVTAPLTRTYAVPPGALLAGVTWSSGAAAVAVRTATGWDDLDVDTTGRPGTEPAWVGHAALVTFRITPSAPLTGVTVDFAGGTRTTSSAPQTRTLPRLGEVVTRAGWGADEHLRHGKPSYAAVRAVVVHHTVTTNDYSHAEAPSYVRAVYEYHTRSRGWSDIGYNLLVDKYGTVYEGRYGDFAKGVVGSHAAGFNTGTLGVSLLGNYDTVETPPALLAAVARVGGWAAERWHFDPRRTVTLTSQGSERFPRGARVTVSRMLGHRDVGRTACPGRYAYAHLADLRAAAWHVLRAYFGTVVVDGAPVHEPKPVTIKAPLDHAAWWTARITSNGTTFATATGHGTLAVITWDGRLDSGLPAPPALTYQYQFDADDHLHGASDPVSGTFDVGLPAVG